MGDLISRSDFRRVLIEIQTDAEHFGNIERRTEIGSIISLLDRQPTAYNEEKVVAELKDSCDIYSVKYYQEDIEVKAVPIDDAIDIVKKGGIV